MAQALSARAQDGGLICLKEFSLKEPKTKLVASILVKLGCEGKVLIVLDAPNPGLMRASRNLQTVLVRMASDVNAYEVLRCKKLVITQSALDKLGARWN
ncbi:MAG: 50S ribosomal protein L4 [Elusimicrobia bacterium]|nr:50S ribosomal protein L4 [Elusimicrobiota bacterium]